MILSTMELVFKKYKPTCFLKYRHFFSRSMIYFVLWSVFFQTDLQALYSFPPDSVYVCFGPTAKKYHKYRNCKGLSRCSADIKKTSISYATNIGKSPCGFCYSGTYSNTNQPSHVSSSNVSNSNISKQSVVYICSGPHAKRYHKTSSCKGLSRCSGSIYSLSLEQAQQKNKTPCQFCY